MCWSRWGWWWWSWGGWSWGGWWCKWESNEWSTDQSRVSQSWHPHIVLRFQSWLWSSFVIIRTTRSIMMIFFALNNYQSYDAFEDGYELCSCNCLNMFIILLKSRDPFQQKWFWKYRFQSMLVRLMRRDSHICWKCVQVILEAALMGTTQKSAVMSGFNCFVLLNWFYITFICKGHCGQMISKV